MRSPKLTSLVFSLAFLFLLGFSSCEKDACEGLDCGTGQCMAGSCFCDSLHEGLNCELLASEKFKGIWTAGDICGSVSTVYECEVTEGGNEGQLVLDPFGPDRLPVIALVSNNDLIIPEQAYGQAVIHGRGGISET